MLESVQFGPQWVLTPEDVRAIANDYALIVSAKDTQILSGAINGVLRVASSAGDVVLRVHRPWTTPARLTAIHGIFDTLRLAGLPIPRILPARTGATWTQLADRLVEVAEFVPSEHSADTWARSTPAFATLARLHAALAELPAGTIPPPAYSSYATPDTALAMLAETEEHFVSHDDSPGYGEAAAARYATRILLQALGVERTRYESLLPRSLIHGDYGGDNVLLRGDQVVAILDFDFLAERERIFDLAYGLYWASDRFSLPLDASPLPATCLASAAELLRQYQLHATLPLTRQEVAALPFEMARIPLYQLAEAGYLTDEHVPAGPVGQTLRFAHHLSRAEAFADDAARIGHLFANVLG